MSFKGSTSRILERVWLPAVSFGLLVALLAPASILAAPAAVDSVPAGPDIFVTPNPCITDPVTVYIRGYVATPCDSFLYAYRSGEREIVVRTITRTDLRCFAAPSIFYAVPVSFGLLPAGTHTVVIKRRQLSWSGDPSAIDSVTTSSEISFSVADACPDPPMPIPAHQLPYVETAHTVPSPACPDRPVTVELAGHFTDGCGRVVSAHMQDGMPRLVLAPYPQEIRGCTDNVPPWSARWSVGLVSPGFHSVTIEQTILGTNAVWPPILDQKRLSLLDFTVASQCDSLSAGPLPFVDFIEIGPAEPKPSNLICQDMPYRVSLRGTFPNDCYRIRKVDVFPNRGLGRPALVQIVVDDQKCVLQLCNNWPAPWDTSVVLPGLPAGLYRQEIQLGMVLACNDSIPGDSLYTTMVPFSVVAAESCDVAPPGGACLDQSWATGGTYGCNAFISQSTTAQLDFAVRSGAALSGLEGNFRVYPMGLQVKSIEAIGPATGMRLTWTSIDQGARFVMFAEHGAPIPASNNPVTVLRVTLEPSRTRVAWPDAFYLLAESLLGADIEGREVFPCITDMRVAPPIVRICVEQPCDFDANGVADVRDLVRMVHCVHGEGPCPPDSTGQFDCNSDGTFGLSDVLCCAVHVLHGPTCPTCPIDSTRVEPEVRAQFEPPIVTATGIDIPLQLLGAYRLGAARLALRFPADRFTFEGAESHTSSWMELHESSDGQASVGLIRVGPDIEVDAPLSGTTMSLLLHLRLKPGATLGGEISIEGGEFSGRDGVMLRVDLGDPRRSLDGKASLAITSIRPNPSAAAFRISVNLDAPAHLDVSVHDIAGRRVASLFNGDQVAGTGEYTWDGLSSDGVKARGGIYFLRATVAGRTAVKKMILLNRGSSSVVPH